MSLIPHLHLLLPSSTSDTTLEARLYLPSTLTVPLLAQISRTTSSDPIQVKSISAKVYTTLRTAGIRRLITSSHPYSHLGGNLLDPVISDHLVNVATSHTLSTAVLAYNFRGVGKSGGIKTVIGVGYGLEDFEKVESCIADLLGGEIETLRFGYSWGSLCAVNAPRTRPITRTLLIAPPLTLFKAISPFTTSFQNGLQQLVASYNVISSSSSSSSSFSLSGSSSSEIPRINSKSEQRRHKSDIPNVWIVYGTLDQFTGPTSFRALGYTSRGSEGGGSTSDNENQPKPGVRLWEVEGGDHFFRSELASVELEKAIKAWLDC